MRWQKSEPRLVIIGADADIGDDVLSIPKKDWDFKTQKLGLQGQVVQRRLCGFIRAEALKEFLGSWEDRMQPGARCMSRCRYNSFVREGFLLEDSIGDHGQ